METEAGDAYLRRIAEFIRAHENRLAEAAFPRRRRRQTVPANASSSVFNPLLGWFTPASAPSPSVKPLVLSLDTHHLFYILMRLEAIGMDVGSLDVHVVNPSRPMNFIKVFSASDRTDTLSIRSSFSAVSALSLGAGWWGRAMPPSLDSELKYIYSSFTKLPALSLSAPGRKMIKELENEPPNENALPLDTFKNLQSLECTDIDPRTLLGWDRLAEGLRSLTVKRSGLEDVSDIFVEAVLDDQTGREGRASRTRQRKFTPGANRRTSSNTTRLPVSVPEDEVVEIPSPSAEQEQAEQTGEPHFSLPQAQVSLSSLKWAFLKHLSLADNALTFLPIAPLQYITSVTHLDLSSNLLVSIPPGLSTLHNLVSLNLSDNMIDSVLGIYTNLGQVLTLNLSRNRLESICGLERLPALERVDLRSNRIDEAAEIGRLATLPNISEVWVEGNPLVEYENSYRITCFDFFWKEGKNIVLDGSPPGFYERRRLTVSLPQHTPSSQPIPTAYSPPAVAVTSSPASIARTSSPPMTPMHVSTHVRLPGHPRSASSSASPRLKPRRKRNKRIVVLDGELSDTTATPPGHSRAHSETGARSVDAPPANAPTPSTEPADTPPPEDTVAVPAPPSPSRDARLSAHPKHSRHQSEFLPSSSSAPIGRMPLSALDYVPEDGSPSSPPAASSPPIPRYLPRGSATISSGTAARRTRVSASLYEAPSAPSVSAPEEYRKRIEALRSDMGEGWLKVYSQSQLGGVGAGAA